MSVLRRAILYTTRKWQQSVIIFLVLVVVCTSTLVGFAILKASDLEAANLRRQFGATFGMEVDMDNKANMKDAAFSDQYSASYYTGKYLDNSVIDEVMKTSGISEYSANIDAVANLKSADGKYYNLVENPMYYYSFGKHRAMIQSFTSLDQCSYFAEKILEVTQGEMLTEESVGHAVISRELAEINHIEIGDKLTLEINSEVVGFNIPKEKQDCVFEVVGIFDILEEQKVDQYTSQRQMLQNWVFVDPRTLLPYLNVLLYSIGEQPIGYDEVTFRVDDPAQIDTIIKDIQQNKAIDWDCFKIKIDNKNYQGAESTLKGMDNGIRIMILVIAATGIGILILLLSIWAKFRILETGILLSVGRGKVEILAQRVIEILLISVLAFCISYVCGNLLAYDVGNTLLARMNEQNADNEKIDSMYPEIPTSAGDLSPVFSAPQVENLTVNISVDTIVAVYAMELLIVLVSVCAAGIPLMGTKPKAIFAKYE